MKRLLLALSLVAVIAVGFVVYSQSTNPEGDVPIQEGIDTPVISEAAAISAEAQVVPLYHMPHSFPVGGQVATISVAEGEMVQTGDLLISLETATLETALRQAEAGVTQSTAAIAEAEANLTVAEAQLDTVVDEDVVQEEPAIDEVEAEANVSRAEAAVERANAGLVQAEAAREAAEKALEQATLHALFDGVVADIVVKPGTVITPGTPVIVLADFSEWQVETTDLTELDIVSVEIDMPVEVKIDALPDETLTGTIVDIEQISSLTRGDVTYVATVQLQEAAQQLPLRWGMTAFVNIDVD